MQAKYRVRDVETKDILGFERLRNDLSPDNRFGFVWMYRMPHWGDKRWEFGACGRGIREQFTGLLDKNGVDYYQGDKVKGPTGMVSVVVYTNGGFWLHRVKSQSAMELYLEAEDSEVIGTSHDKEVDK